jgi:hypothetical protein
MSLSVRNSGLWEEVKALSVHSGGDFVPVKKAFVNQGGTWHEYFSSAPIAPMTGYSFYNFEESYPEGVVDVLRPGVENYLVLGSSQTIADGQDGKCLLTVDTSYFAMISDFNSMATAVSISFWFFISSAESFDGDSLIRIYSNNGDNKFRITPEEGGTNEVVFQLYNSSGGGSSCYADFVLDQWNHIIFTFDESTGDQFIYLNNVEADTAWTTSVMNAGVDSIEISGPNNSMVDNLSFYEKILTPEERTQIFNYRSGG